MEAMKLFAFFFFFFPLFFFYATVALLAWEKGGLRAQAPCAKAPGLGAEEASGGSGWEAASECGREADIVGLVFRIRSALL